MSLPLSIRKNIKSVEQDENGLNKLTNAFRISMNCTDNRGYGHIAGFHGVPDFYCWHHQNVTGTTVRARIFLPWHRAYLSWLEFYLKELAKDTTVTIPWWDWTTEREIPKAYSENMINGQPNPLQKFHIDIPSWGITRDTERDPSPPDLLPTEDEVNDIIYHTPDFEDFEIKIEDVHDTVHGWVGGSMGIVGIAAFDPIFWAHHCMIDRIWYLWQIANYQEKGFEQMRDLPLAPFNLNVKGVLDLRRLGYEYARNTASVSVSSTIGE
jgi:tyrosinase